MCLYFFSIWPILEARAEVLAIISLLFWKILDTKICSENIWPLVCLLVTNGSWSATVGHSAYKSIKKNTGKLGKFGMWNIQIFNVIYFSYSKRIEEASNRILTQLKPSGLLTIRQALNKALWQQWLVWPQIKGWN